MIFSEILATAGTPAHGDVRLGTLFDCQKTRNKGLYSFSQIDFCKKGYNGDPKRFTAEVFSYHPQTKPIQMILCTWFVEDYLCYKRFFGSFDRYMTFRESRTLAGQCERAYKEKLSPHGHRLHPLTATHYRTQPKITWDCSWMRHMDHRLFGFDIKIRPARIKAGETLIQQDVTNSRCYTTLGHCRPKEDTKKIIIYGPKPKMKPIYKSLGRHEIIMTHNMISIPTVGSGGGISRRNKASITLDTGLIKKTRPLC